MANASLKLGNTEVFSEASGVVTLKNAILNSTNTFPAGTTLQTVKSLQLSGAAVIGNVSSTTSFTTILTATITNVLASSKILGFFYSGSMLQNSNQTLNLYVTGGGLSQATATHYFNQTNSTRVPASIWFFDDNPATGSNTYTLKGSSNGSGDGSYFCLNSGFMYGSVLYEIAV